MQLSRMAVPALLVVGALVLAIVLLFFIQPATDVADQAEKPEPTPSKPALAARPSSDFGDSPMRPATPVALARSDDAGDAEDFDFADMDTEVMPWEAPINAILESPDDNDQVALRLAGLVPTLPPDGQVEAAQHMVNLLDDENYQTALQMLVNPATPVEVREVIYSDILNRPNTVKLPALVAVVGTPGHSLRDEALGTLQIFVGEDLGNNPQAWSNAVQQFLRVEASEDEFDYGMPEAVAP
jgi:hypothetical protein